MKFEEIGPWFSAEKSFKGVDTQRMDDGQQVITIAHPEPSIQVS